MNFCFVPIIYLFYPETKKRSLEEIDIIFAKGYMENISYVKASFELPYLNDREVDQMAREYGFTDKDEEFKAGGQKEEKWAQERSDSEGTLSAANRAPGAGNHEAVGEEQDGGLRND